MVSQSANGLGSGSGIVDSTSRLPVAGAYVRLGAHSGLKSDIARGPKSAMTGHPRPVGSSEKCHKRKSSPNLIAKCSERDAQSANETFHGRSSVSIADLPLKK